MTNKPDLTLEQKLGKEFPRINRQFMRRFTYSFRTHDTNPLTGKSGHSLYFFPHKKITTKDGTQIYTAQFPAAELQSPKIVLAFNIIHYDASDPNAWYIGASIVRNQRYVITISPNGSDETERYRLSFETEEAARRTYLKIGHTYTNLGSPKEKQPLAEYFHLDGPEPTNSEMPFILDGSLKQVDSGFLWKLFKVHVLNYQSTYDGRQRF